MRVDIYFNIHKSKQSNEKIFSVKDKKTNKVVNHLAGGFFIKNAQFIVNESGRQRVLSERKKNVHAFIRGELLFSEIPSKESSATYNPYLYSSFVDTVSKERVFRSDLVYIDKDGKIYYR